MGDALTAAQMRATEGAAIAAGKVTGRALMERAGHGVVDAIFQEWPELWDGHRRARVLAGPGNNGGDGFVIARLLAQRGWEVEVFFYGDLQNLPPDAKANAERWIASGGAVSPIVPQDGRDMRLADPAVDVWIDAVFGIGLTRPLPREVVAAFESISDARRDPQNRLVAVDILSGVDADTGERLSVFPLVADLTVTFHALKKGHVEGAGPEVSGKVVVKDIGL